MLFVQAEEIQSQMDNAGGDELKRQKEVVEKLQAVSDSDCHRFSE